jgi:hypothetical protein
MALVNAHHSNVHALQYLGRVEPGHNKLVFRKATLMIAILSFGFLLRCYGVLRE